MFSAKCIVIVDKGISEDNQNLMKRKLENVTLEVILVLTAVN